MKIIIPMTGYGSRFAAAGYENIKPLIQVHQKPIIEWVVEMFPGENDFLFICRQDHMETTNLESELKRIKPSGKIIALDNWEKLGPVNDVCRVAQHIEDDEQVIVNYCDFYMQWDWHDFKKFVADPDVKGCIPCYTGFHPHLLPAQNVYASCKVDAHMQLLEIREKFSFSPDKKDALHSAGTYYFQSGRLLKESFKSLVDSQDTLNGEYYVSMAYQNMIAQKYATFVYDKVSHFCQWGTPQDLEEYLMWVEKICKGEQ